MALSSKFLRGALAGVAGAAVAVTGFAAPALATVNTDGAIIQPSAAEGITQINLIGYNDFHGRLSTLEKFAGTVLQTRDAFGASGSLIIGNGDQVGASEFESAVQQDQPTIDALLEFGANQTITAGNHEFDAGYDDAKNRIAPEFAGVGGVLAANVTLADGSPALDAYRIVEINGVSVAVIGAVTGDTAALVSPDGIAGLTFGDPVAAVNAYAAQLSDGDAANGEADVIIASYHEGGPVAGAADDNLSNAVFADIVNNTSAEVDAIYNAHTHRSYAYDLPVPGVEGKTRPVLQSGEYGNQISQLVFDIDATGAIVASTSVLITTAAVDAASLSAESATAYNNILAIKAAAITQAGVLGAEPIGVVNVDFSRGAVAWSGGVAGAADQRHEESALGTVVADSMNIWAQNNTTIGSDLSIMNPGGIRSGIAGDGVLTYKDAQTVLPFVNNLSVVELTGATLKAVFENQWQRDVEGNVPSRPYLQLGLSSNVQYTYDANLPEGNRITSITINGAPLDFAATYKVTMPSFLAAGGDNFHAIKDAAAKHDTGWVDLDAFKSYVASLPNKELKDDPYRNGFQVEGYFAEAPTADAFAAAPVLAAGDTHTFTVKNVDLRSTGFIANTTVEAFIDEIPVGTATITGVTANGETTMAELTITVPTSIPGGLNNLHLVAQPSGSFVDLPIFVTNPQITVDPSVAAPGDEVTVTLTGFAANDEVRLELHSTPAVLGTVTTDANGSATFTFTVPNGTEPGAHTVVAFSSLSETAEAAITIEYAPELAVEKDTYTQEESKAGVNYAGTGWVPDTALTVSLTDPNGVTSEVSTGTADADGNFAGSLTWATFDGETGELIEDNLPWPAGVYTITVTQGDLVKTVTFTVLSADGSAPVPPAPGAPGATAGSGTTGGLAVTGAEGGPLTIGLAAALLIAAAGITLMLRRRNA